MKVGKKNKMVFVAMSGGVDSSVAALLLKKEGYKVAGVFIHCFNVDGCEAREAEDARRVAEKLRIPFYVWDFEKEYKKRVVKYMVDGYRQGITPNPDVMCNKEIKFGLFLDRALAAGADLVATGHYVRLITRENSVFSTHFTHSSGELDLSSAAGRRKTASRAQPPARVSRNAIFSLLSARDKNKDQSYFLWTLKQEQLAHCLFPIGDYLKPQVREIARRAGLPTADKKDSQGICFLGKVTLSDFLKSYIRPKRGEIVTVSGKKVGEHEGVYFYTIGQRHLGISNLEYQKSKIGSDRKPYYVAEKDVQTNKLVVVEGEDNKSLYQTEVTLTNVSFINPNTHSLIRANGGVGVLARVRYRQPVGAARLMASRAGFKLVFDKPQKFIAPGQSAVWYSKKGEMLGGGVIV